VYNIIANKEKERDDFNGHNTTFDPILSLLEKIMVRILLPLKIPHLALNLQLLGPVASTLTTRPLRATPVLLKSVLKNQINHFSTYVFNVLYQRNSC
jgi:hypothetical protein